ncbi:MAG: helicase C-terminal domain-containing protein [Candidatus Dormibacteria bacterium]
MSDLVAFDLETTGLSPKSDRIIEIGAVRFRSSGALLGDFDVLVDPGMAIPLAIERLTGISAALVEGAPTAAEAVAQFADFCAGAQLVAHGAAFDLGFCAGLLPQQFMGREVLDTLELARVLLPVAASHSLPQLSRDLGLVHLRPHRADSDAGATRDLLLHLLAVAAALPGETLRLMGSLVEPLRSPLRSFFHVRVPEFRGAVPKRRAGLPATVAGGAPQAGGAARAAPSAGLPDDPRLPSGSRQSLADRVAALCSPGGPLGGGHGYEVRSGQQQMALAVAQTIDRSGRLLVEAGTGIGKSLAYLLPLSLHAQAPGARAVVATATIPLQEQLVDVEFPRVAAWLDHPPRVALLKGRQHYLSLRRWSRFLGRPDTGAHGVDLDRVRFKLKVLTWLAETSTGDRAELRLGAAEEPLWRLVESAADDCLGAGCANWGNAGCYMTRARAAAAEADLVVTNHALLLADSERHGQLVGPHSVLVIDEAHRLEESATRQWGVRLTAADVQAVLERLPELEREAPASLAVARVHDGSGRLFGALKGFLTEHYGTDQPGNASLGLPEELRAADSFRPVLRDAGALVSAVQRAAAELRALGSDEPAAPAGPERPEQLRDELELAALALEGIGASLERTLLAPRAGHVRWVALRAEQAELHEAPVEVGDRLREAVLRRPDAAVLTSATLSVGGSFDYVRHRLGLGGEGEELVVASPFDFLGQALTVVPEGIPRHDDPDYDAALQSLVADLGRRLGGRTLVLFTGYGPLRRLHAPLKRRLEPQGIAVLGQGLDGTRRQLLASFLANRRTVLLGTATFWEGIDVPGDALSCVVIAKLPFPVPTDPLVQARTAGLGDPFRDHALPVAALRLRQGFGRLIRREGDRGAVVLCDPRIATHEYGPAFLAALPPARVARPALSGAARVVEDFVQGRWVEVDPDSRPAPAAEVWHSEQA